MSSSAPPSVEQKPSTPPPPRRSPVKWLMGALAAAVVVVAAVASAVLWSGEDDDTTATKQTPASPPSASAGAGQSGAAQTGAGQPSAGQPSAGQPSAGRSNTGRPIALTVKPQQGRCLLPSPDRLKTSAALAFEGTVARVDAGSRTAVVDVTKWLFADGFGGTDTVRIQLPQAGTESTPTFEKGHTYLVAATGQGEVMGCGFTGEKSGGLSTLYGRAFV